MLNGKRIDLKNSIIFVQPLNSVRAKDNIICFGAEIGTPSTLNLSFTNYDGKNSGWKLTLGANTNGDASAEAVYLIRLMRSKSLIMNCILGGGALIGSLAATNNLFAIGYIGSIFVALATLICLYLIRGRFSANVIIKNNSAH